MVGSNATRAWHAGQSIVLNLPANRLRIPMREVVLSAYDEIPSADPHARPQLVHATDFPGDGVPCGAVMEAIGELLTRDDSSRVECIFSSACLRLVYTDLPRCSPAAAPC